MKKLLLLGALISSVAMAEGNEREVRAGVDFGSTSITSGPGAGEKSSKMKSGFELAGEYRTDLGSGFQLGGGLAYRYSKLPKLPGGTTKGFHSVPLYATARYNFSTGSDVVPYVKANLGYAFNSGSMKREWRIPGLSHGKDEVKFGSGMYYGVGAGIQFKNFVVDLTWSSTSTKTKFDFETNISNPLTGSLVSEKETMNRTLRYNVVTLGFGYTFGF